jgi:hypothetical protein
MKRHGAPELIVFVWGDWHTVISARDYRDSLLDQKPFDEEDAQYGQYELICGTTQEMVDAHRAFRKLQLKCAFGFRFKSDDKAVEVYASSDDGYSSSGAHCHVDVVEDERPIVSVVKRVLGELSDAID